MTRPFLTPKRFAAVAIVTGLLIFGFYFGDNIDRVCILFALLAFAPTMAGGVPEAEHLADEEMDG